jgi:hypothetical protein
LAAHAQREAETAAFERRRIPARGFASLRGGQAATRWAIVSRPPVVIALRSMTHVSRVVRSAMDH